LHPTCTISLHPPEHARSSSTCVRSCAAFISHARRDGVDGSKSPLSLKKRRQKGAPGLVRGAHTVHVVVVLASSPRAPFPRLLVIEQHAAYELAAERPVTSEVHNGTLLWNQKFVTTMPVHQKFATTMHVQQKFTATISVQHKFTTTLFVPQKFRKTISVRQNFKRQYPYVKTSERQYLYVKTSNDNIRTSKLQNGNICTIYRY